MSAVAELEVENFKKKAKEAQAEIIKLEKQLIELEKQKLNFSDKADLERNKAAIKQTTIELKEQRIALRETNVELKNRAQALKTAGTAQQQFRSQVGSSNAVALEFNRIIQDAPFGIIGIGNNIQQLTANFAQLRAGSASTGAALKASLLSIVSPANLVLLGVSAITSLWTAYQLGAFDSLVATKNLAKELEKFKENLSAVDSARLKGISTSEDEILTINSLRGIIENETNSRNDRLKAIEKLQDLYPAYFGNLSEEDLLSGKLVKVYEALTKTIIAKAQAQASTAKFVELADEERLLLEKTAEVRARIADFEAKALKNQQDGQVELQLINENQARFLANQIKPETDRIKQITEEKKKLEEDITKNLIEANLLLTDQKSKYKEIVKEVEYIDEAWNKFEDTTQRLAPKLQEIADKFNAIGQVLPTEAPVIEVADRVPLGIVQSLQDQIDMYKKLRDAQTDISGFTKNNEEVKKLEAELKKLLGTGQEVQKLYATEALGGNPFSFLIDSIFKFQEVKKSLDDFADGSEEKMQLLRDQAVLTGNIFSGLGDTFASVFASGNRELGQFISALGDFIGQLVVFAKIQQQSSAAVVAAKQSEATASAISAGAQTAASKGPAAFYTLAPLIASAVALVGSAFRGLGGARNTGGRSSATSSASLNTVGSSFAGFGATANPFGDLTLRASIRGTDIELLLERTTVKNRA